MSRVGKKEIVWDKGIDLKIQDNKVTVKGSKGELEFNIPSSIQYTLGENTLSFTREDNEKHVRAAHGMSRAIVASMIEGVSKGIEKKLKINGVGYRVEMKGKALLLTLGYSHPILFIPPNGIEFVIHSQTNFSVVGIDKQLVGEVAAKIRRLRLPEPYKGKGVMYENEVILRKAGKTGK